LHSLRLARRRRQLPSLRSLGLLLAHPPTLIRISSRVPDIPARPRLSMPTVRHIPSSSTLTSEEIDWIKDRISLRATAYRFEYQMAAHFGNIRPRGVQRLVLADLHTTEPVSERCKRCGLSLWECCRLKESMYVTRLRIIARNEHSFSNAPVLVSGYGWTDWLGDSGRSDQ
jgi:hypothetical protein